MKELAEIKINVNLNFFAESHGKNSRDQHFSCISSFLKQSQDEMKLVNTEDVLKAILNGQKRANFHRKFRSNSNLY